MYYRKTVLLLSLLLMTFMVNCSEDTSGETAEEEVVAVEVFPVQRMEVHRTLNLLGDIHAKQSVRVFSKVPDRIMKFHVDMGDTVTQDQLIAEIQNESIRSRVKQVEANLAQALSQLDNLENEFQRMQRLYKEDAVSQQQYDGTKTQLEATRAQVRSLQEGLNQAKTQLEESYIRSPLNGLIGQRFLEVGDMASQTPVVSVVQMDTVKVLVNVIERHAPEIRVGLQAQTTVNGLPDTVFYGTVTKVSPVIDPMSRMVRTEIEIPNSDYLLRPGMFAEVKILLETRPNALVIPKYAILQKTEMARGADGQQRITRENHVYTIQNDMAQYRTIEIGIEEEGMVEVTSGLRENDPVVLLGQNNLQDSTRVRVVEEDQVI
ncbi:MAG: efflux RND transporter periplasmic adaptor subunit [Candidatus Marinimicrobia bacterium]|nr:efflux RND transporter periplasmic adaptor subunit [Candidatus Neomarinimicrobiota bacterium]MCF7830067.1 efflux RND transporter periplasmic adaptor subunit [Candidatus Neomarinimicrobiota bacterium]MCF7882114.1 efflux RND transporter periplasmic adaptor subunit [Candidatus Neomarinimicrobiota bacterium]